MVAPVATGKNVTAASSVGEKRVEGGQVLQGVRVVDVMFNAMTTWMKLTPSARRVTG
ncbi:MAG TPA: hypothetical protein VIA11_14735 [Acidimicrobiia bacterium]|jgi:hypothetical protein|nr:hypothetical protein [Acidimicrobiia bacterium]